MPQSLARFHTHLIFSTKQRAALLHDGVRDALHRHMGTVLKNNGCPCILINSVEDHVHILFELGRTVSISSAVEQVKKSSSKWIKTQGLEFASFRWQEGYGAFAVSALDVPDVHAYIAGQRDHHVKQSFTDEYRNVLTENGLAFDENYVWD